MNSIYKAVSMLFLVIVLPVQAELTALEDNRLGDIYGQAIFEVTNQDIVQPGGNSLEMVKLTVGARVEINANIDEVSLGRYWRPEGNNCTGGPGNALCLNNVANATPAEKNLDWACTGNPCGHVEMSDTTYMSSDLTHGKTLTFFAFPGGFEPDGGVDIKLRDVTMGRVMIKDGKRILEPFIQENPYIEVAFDKNASGIRELAGFRVGSEDSYGIQGNVIDVISGYITPEITAEVIVPVLGNVGTLYMTAPLGGVRTIGFIDEDTADVSNNTGGLIQIIEGIAGIEGLAPTAQLYPVQGNYLNHTRAFFLSANSKPIQWGAIGGYTPAVTKTGFWLNMGGDGRLEATTRELDHPINYFPGHPKLAKYGASTNYTKNVGQFSETYQ